MKTNIPLFLSLLLLFSCGDDDGTDLPPVEQRVEEAVADLTAELTRPANGWRLDYQPTPDAGLLYMLLEFDDEGNVNIQSDVAANDGEFFDQTITYRIDNTSELELVMETFAVFHYLFELDQTTFGAEFEFTYVGKDGDNLRFESKKDLFDKTQLIFTPASADAESLFSRELSANLDLLK